MRTWSLAGTGVGCGLCGEPIATGSPVLELSGPGWKLRRCERCADEPKPEHVTESRPGLVLLKRAAEARPLAALAADFKIKQGADR